MNPQKLSAMLITLACGLFLAAGAHAQDTNAPRTELDAFESRVGVVIIRGSTDIGVVRTANGTILVRCKESIDAGSGVNQHGISITLAVTEQQSDTTIIDYDELNSFLIGLDALANANWSLTTLQNFDAVYTTRDGLQASAYSSKRQPGALGASLKSNRNVKVRVPLAPQDLAQFRELIQQAKSKLDALHGAR